MAHLLRLIFSCVVAATLCGCDGETDDPCPDECNTPGEPISSCPAECWAPADP